MSDVERRHHTHESCWCHISPPCGECVDCEICNVDEDSVVGVFIDELISKVARYDALQAKVSEAVALHTEKIPDSLRRGVEPGICRLCCERWPCRTVAILSDTSQTTKEH